MPLARTFTRVAIVGALLTTGLALAVSARSPGASATTNTVATINPTGGTNANDGLKIVYSNGQFQVVRNGQTQLYNNNTQVPGSFYMNNQIALAVGDATTGGTVVIPYWGSVSEAGNVTEANWDHYATTEAVTTSAGVWAFQSVLSETISGRLYVVTVSASYTQPNDFFDLTLTTSTPTGNDKPVRLYLVFDSYLAGSDRGPGFYNDSTCEGFPIVGVTPPSSSSTQLVQGIQYVSGPAWAGYASARYVDVVESSSGYGPGFMTDLPNVIDARNTVDNGFGVNWNFGSTPGTQRATARFIFSTSLNAITECPTPEPEQEEESSHSGTAPVVLPPAVSELISQPVASTSTSVPAAPSTTQAATTTVAPATTVPTPVAVGGALPQLEPGERQVLLDGEPVDVEVFVDNSTDLVMRGQDFLLRLKGDCRDDCTIDVQESGRELLTLEEGGRANVSGEGFLVGTPVHIWLFSEPRYLGYLIVQEDGTFAGQVPLLDVAPGLHTLQVNGTSFDGLPRSANLGVRVLGSPAPAPDSGVLPSTGTSNAPLWILGLALIGLGIIATSRRRNPTL